MEWRGLDEEEAKRRLAADGPNALPRTRSRSLIRFFLEVFEEPIFLLLAGAAVLYIAIGDSGEGLLLAACAAVSVALVAVQSWRSERVLTALRDVTAPRARVVRAGVSTRRAAAEIVVGDVVVLAAGDRVPADGIVRQGAGLVVDESALTGESIPVRKVAEDGPPANAEEGSLVFSGTLVLAGEGLSEVTATGARSRIGEIGAALTQTHWPRTPLQAAMSRLARRLALVGAGLSILLGALHYARHGDWLEATLAGITLAMSAMPEELPMVLAIFVAVGAWRLSRGGVLARQPSAILALGATTVLCVDKTGTITENRIVLERLATLEATATAAEAQADPRFALLAAAALRASHPHGGDPMDRATLALGEAPREELLREYPITPEQPRVAFAWDAAGRVVVAAKGAPEAIARLSGLDAAAHARMIAQVDAFAQQGLRVLAVAVAQAAAAPERVEDLRFAFLGLLGFKDPVRESARGSVTECRDAGIDVVMITGDYPATAHAIARDAGIEAGGPVIGGADIARLDDIALANTAEGVNVFARIEPRQKLRVVQALQARGHVVAMTGDGVNDAPALRAAHVGVAMGTRGTDVAREAAGLVVLNDDLGSIVSAIRLGRRIADNLRKVMVFIVAVHVPMIGLALLPLLLGWPLMLSPVHVIFLELVIDPTCAIVFESQKEEPGAMKRPPRGAHHAIVSPLTVALGLAQGGALLAGVLAVYGWVLAQGAPVDSARALAFLALVSGTLAMSLVNLSWVRSAFSIDVLARPAFAIAAGLTLSVLALLFASSATRAVFDFAVPEPGAAATAMLVGAASVLWFELVKLSGILQRRD